MKILLIDDDPGIAETVSLAFELRWPDAKVLAAESGEMGLAVLDSQEFQLIILDIGLPGIDGFGVLGAIRSLSDVPVIMLTVRGAEADVVKALNMGADDYVVKPFSYLVLLARAQSVLRRTFTGIKNKVLLVP